MNWQRTAKRRCALLFLGLSVCLSYGDLVIGQTSQSPLSLAPTTAGSTFATDSFIDNAEHAHITRLLKEKPVSNFADQFWTYLLRNNYKHWSPGPHSSADFIPMPSAGRSFHTSFVKRYFNRTALSDLQRLPAGSIIVLENYLSDRSLESISVMYRSPNFSQSDAWYWIQYLPDGSVAKSERIADHRKMNDSAVAVAAMTFTSAASSTPLVPPSGSLKRPRFALAGQVNACIRCHRTASDSLVHFTAPSSPTARFSRKDIDLDSADNAVRPLEMN